MDGNGKTFNDQVEATSFAGDAGARILALENKVGQIFTMVLSMKSTQDKFLGVLALGAVVLPILVSIALHMYFPETIVVRTQ